MLFLINFALCTKNKLVYFLLRPLNEKLSDPTIQKVAHLLFLPCKGVYFLNSLVEKF